MFKIVLWRFCHINIHLSSLTALHFFYCFTQLQKGFLVDLFAQMMIIVYLNADSYNTQIVIMLLNCHGHLQNV